MDRRATALGLLIPSAVASADVTDLSGATISDAADLAAATVNNTEQTANDPNTTCYLKAAGGNVVPRTNLVVGEVYAEDVSTATGECVSFDTSSYTVRLTANLQAYIPTSLGYHWVTFCSTSTSQGSVDGVTVPLIAHTVCDLGAPSPYLNSYHRVQGILTDSRGQTFLDYSPIWFDTP
jgi:hypothetical protein